MNTIGVIVMHGSCCVIGIVGCDRHGSTGSIICLIANNDNNFLNEGIVEKSIIFLDTKGKYEPGKLNVFEREHEITKFKISRTQLPEAKFVGRIIMTANQYE